MKIHIDEFSGIGGLSLAADLVWDDMTHVFVEYDPFLQKELERLWPESEIFGNIKTFVADSEKWRRERGKVPIRSGKPQKPKTNSDGSIIASANTDKQRRVHRKSEEQSTDGRQQTFGESFASSEPPFLLTGGFPCQPFSNAGRRKGTEDDRYLWPYMLESIAFYRPRWVVAENVAGLVNWNSGLVLETVCSDLEKERYEVCPIVIPAVSKSAPHRRDRVWIIGRETSSEPIRSSQEREVARNLLYQTERGQIRDSFGESDIDASDSSRESLERNLTRFKTAGHSKFRNRIGSEEKSTWDEDWTQVATRLCFVDDGLPNGLARRQRSQIYKAVKFFGRTEAERLLGGNISLERVDPWRSEKLKAAGNAIVPQIAEQIFRFIKEIDPV